MASGFGARGSEGRCAPVWREFTKCVNEADDRSACFKFREDYVECLHHKKEYRRENEIENERQRRNEEHANAKKEALLKEMRTFSWVTDEKYAPKK
ncbi:predicted protein [Ostreococcus lucimarinus CCE9901]|uniref:NADH dehydrogenase [ubiquinone] iron-sulfur protein 5 n=1 Tax=Ostreococcus lucimarinus (strain CCE9901) TaxID=436017 RepID=A4S5C5_OSTLU|nr:predicted protein [Ostreococcus lucimarinus CCE9901]ABO98876.1 predicted protein [Ostreococcus lucimarinus CCE9901]|eukprot:XP_001420583.1 predicted protein [Ostreococcus lucimarinus CCE9901]